ncbi:MAG: cadherin-like beta sandwich domain-containing protein [Oscillospiraceae bacterium]|nr:cadherin-like beta sandwich domain-containing protein [Oscillospiraceae bacterium]
MRKCSFTKIFLMTTLFLFLIIAGGCGGGGGGNPATGPMLSGLQLSIGELSPDFSPATTQYTISVTNSVTSISITPTTNYVNVIISVNGVNVASGSASAAINLNMGLNTIAIIVENSAGQTTYTVTIMRNSEPIYQKITPESAREMMTQTSGYILLDVRTEDEYNDMRIPGAVLMPHTEIEFRAGAELPNKSQIIFVYCQAGIRSEIAARALVELGYSNVFDMGGIIDWPYETIGNPPPPNWYEVADTLWWDAASNDNSYTISTPQQFAGFAKIVNSGITDFSGNTITVANDINLAGKEWEAITGNFRGVLDGDGHEISGVKVSSFYGDIGLFGILETAGTIKNIKLTYLDIQAYSG